MYYAYFYLTFEASTPFLNIYWLLAKLDFPDTHPLKVINGVLLVLVFFAFRIVSGIGYSVVVWRKLDERLPHLPDASDRHFVYYYKFALVSLSALNLYWFFLLVRGLVAKVTKRGTTAHTKDE